MTSDDLDAAVHALLDSVSVMTVATSADGHPWAAVVYFAARRIRVLLLRQPRGIPKCC